MMLTCGISREIIALRAAKMPEMNWRKQEREDESIGANKAPWSLHKREASGLSQ